jgi:hypothetical protein
VPPGPLSLFSLSIPPNNPGLSFLTFFCEEFIFSKLCEFFNCFSHFFPKNNFLEVAQLYIFRKKILVILGDALILISLETRIKLVNLEAVTFLSRSFV